MTLQIKQFQEDDDVVVAHASLLYFQLFTLYSTLQIRQKQLSKTLAYKRNNIIIIIFFYYLGVNVYE